MKKFTIGNHLTPYLILACALLAAILALQGNAEYQASTNTSPEPQKTAGKVSGTNFTAPGIHVFSEIVERPLFIEGRKPLPPPVAAPPAPVRVSALRLQLEGVVITPAAKIAVVRDLNTNKILHLTKGMQHQGWELDSIAETIATFRQGEQSQELALKK